MSTFISIDSYFRDLQIYPNPADFYIPPRATDAWASENRTVKAVKSHDRHRIPQILYELKLLRISIPYDASLLNEPYLYVEFRDDNDKSTKLINTIQNITDTTPANLSSAVFQIFYDKSQGSTPTYLIYNCAMNQVMRFNAKGSYHFRVFNRLGNTILSTTFDTPAPNPLLQITASIEVRPWDEKVEPVELHG